MNKDNLTTFSGRNLLGVLWCEFVGCSHTPFMQQLCAAMAAVTLQPCRMFSLDAFTESYVGICGPSKEKNLCWICPNLSKQVALIGVRRDHIRLS